MIAIKKFCYYTILLSLFLISQINFLSAQSNDSILFTKDFFDNDIALELSLRFDIKKFINEKMDEKYLPAILSYFIEDTIELSKNVRIKTRGDSRKNICYFPPFFINIKEANFSDDFFADINKVKVVPLCKNSKEYNRYLIQEYLAYKIFNIITDYSFKVRLLNIKYIDTGRNNKIHNYNAFIIEPEKLLAKRLDAFYLEMDYFSYSQTDTMITTVMSIFQYMIGNTDYSISGRHNLKLFTLKDYTKQSIIPIPYDFDYAGLVNAHYAIPAKKINIEEVTERFYRGLCRSDNLYNIVLDIFREKKDEIFTFIDSCEYLDKKARKYVLRYITDFYDEIENVNFIRKKIRTTCD